MHPGPDPRRIASLGTEHRGRVDLYWIAVDPTAHGGGWGTTLMFAVGMRWETIE